MATPIRSVRAPPRGANSGPNDAAKTVKIGANKFTVAVFEMKLDKAQQISQHDKKIIQGAIELKLIDVIIL